MNHRNLRARLAAMLSCVLIAAFASRFYFGPGAHWVNNLLPSALYIIFWCLLVQYIRPGWKPQRIILGVFTATCLLEFLQLSDAAPLVSIRQYEIGRLLIGTWFDPWDFAHYGLGAVLAWRLLTRWRRP